MKILNPGWEDYHIHSSNFSDWFNTIDEIVQFSGTMWMSKIAITDHCQNSLDVNNYPKKCNRRLLDRYKNVFNEIEVIFGVEADLLNEDGDISSSIQDVEWEFIILSLHKWKYSWDMKNINLAYENAIKKHHDKIRFIGHPTNRSVWNSLDMMRLVKFVNEYKIPLELNGASIMNERINHETAKIMIWNVELLYVNSDAHTLYELKNARKIAFEYLNSII